MGNVPEFSTSFPLLRHTIKFEKFCKDTQIMDEQSKVSQAVVPNQAAVDAQKTQAEGKHYSGGSALLDAEVAEQQMASVPIVKHPITTNITGNTDTDDPADAKKTHHNECPSG